jgi:hypothetical protein
VRDAIESAVSGWSVRYALKIKDAALQMSAYGRLKGVAFKRAEMLGVLGDVVHSKPSLVEFRIELCCGRDYTRA